MRPRSLGRNLWAQRLLHWLVLFATCATAGPALATKTRNAAILTRALSYELTLEERVGSSLVIAVVYKGGDSRSEANADEWLEALRTLSGVRVKNRPLSVLKVSYSPSALLSAIQDDGADVLLVADGLGAQVAAIAGTARSKQVLTASNAVADVVKDLTLCVTEEAEKVKIVVNLNAAHLEGIRFSSSMLKLATIVR